MGALTEMVVLWVFVICIAVVVVMIGLPILFLILSVLMHKWGLY